MPAKSTDKKTKTTKTAKATAKKTSVSKKKSAASSADSAKEVKKTQKSKETLAAADPKKSKAKAFVRKQVEIPGKKLTAAGWKRKMRAVKN